MLLAAEFGTGQVLWSILWFFLFFMWIALVFSVFGDIMRSEMSGWSKALWTFGIIFLPYLGVFLYLIVNGDQMGARSAKAAQAQQAAVDGYIRDVASSGASDELSKLADLHAGGKLTDDEYAAAKAKVIAS
ncbi:MAG: PLDc N-terminal domain-containing protein [Ilumatobacter sp.]